MTTPKSQAPKILFAVSGGETRPEKQDYPLPALLRATTRGGGQEVDPSWQASGSSSVRAGCDHAANREDGPADKPTTALAGRCSCYEALA